ncbi:MAG: SPOR domain-containing protein [Paracoccaceae bacterium]
MMRATDMPVPSYRLGRDSGAGGLTGKLLLFGGGLLAIVAVAMVVMWGLSRGGRGGVPVIEPDPRPFRVRPADPGGMRVQNQNELIFDRRPGQAQPAAGARLAPEAEGPRLEALRQQVAPPPAPRPTATPSTPAPTPAPQQAAVTPAAPPAPTSPAAPAANGRVQVQLGALGTEEAARAEFDRLSRRMPELFANRRPVIARFEREGQATLWRVRTGGFADRAAATQFCEQIRGRGAACTVVAN